MKATVEIPDQLYRQVKARSAIEGRAIRDVTIELYQRWLVEAGFSVTLTEPDSVQSTIEGETPSEAAGWLARWDQIGQELARRSVDPRTTREILVAERR